MSAGEMPGGVPPDPESNPRQRGSLSYCAVEARRHDPERFRAILFTPPDRQEAQFALCTFNHEVAKIRETVSEPMLGAIRLQWWREAIEEIYSGRARRHEVVQALGVAVAKYGLRREHFDRLIDAREFDLKEALPKSLDQLEQYAEGTSAPLVRLGLEVIAGNPEKTEGEAVQAAARGVGAAWSLLGLVRALPVHLSQGKIFLPENLCSAAGLDRRDLLEFRQPEKTAEVVAAVLDRVEVLLVEARQYRGDIARPLRRGLLLACLADHHLKGLRKPGRAVFAMPLHTRPGRGLLRLSFAVMRYRY